MVGRRTVASLGCPRGPAAGATKWASERAAGSARTGAHVGSPRARRSCPTDQPRGSHLGRGSAASARRTRAGPIVGRLRAGRAARAHLGFAGARALSRRAASGTIMGSAQTRGTTGSRALVGSPAFGATPGWPSRGAARQRGPGVGESSCGAVLGFARNGKPCGRACPGLGSARAVMGCPGGRRSECTSRSRAVLGCACARDRSLGRAQERRTWRACGTELVELAAASASHSSATAAASDRGSAARDFSAERGAILVATR